MKEYQMPRLVEEQNILRRLQALEWCYNREGPSVPRYIGTANNNRTLLLQPVGSLKYLTQVILHSPRMIMYYMKYVVQLI